MNKLKTGMAIIAFLCAGMAQASVHYTNESGEAQVVTINVIENAIYYGYSNYYTNNTFTVTLQPNESADYDDYFTTWGDGSDYSQIYTLISVE